MDHHEQPPRSGRDPTTAETAEQLLSLRNGHREALTFEFEPGALEISPGLARVLLRIMRKAAERRGIDLEHTDTAEAIASRP